MPPRLNMVGFTSNRLIVVKRGEGLANGKTCWICECECGNWTIVAVDKLRSGHTKSCGCANEEARRARLPIMCAANTKYPKMDRLDWRKYATYLSFIKHKYSLLEVDIRERLDSQQGCCAICERSLDYLGKNFCIDHNHSTGRVRELLCHNCNIAIGNMQENSEHLRNAADYLERHNE